MNEQWPFNGKSLWASLRPGQRAAVIVGVPVIRMMMMTVIWLSHEIGTPPIVHGVLMFVSFFAVPYVYIRGIGMVVAVLYELIMNRE